MRLPKIFSLAKTGAKTVAVCDIGSGSIAVAIVEKGSNDSKVRILVSERRALQQEERSSTQTVEQLKTLAQETATAVLDQHAKRSGVPPSEVIAIVHAPWVRSETASIIQRFEKPMVITEKIIGETAKRVVREDTKLDAGNIFERSVVRVALSGYPTSEPEGKTAERIQIAVLQSDIQPDVLAAMKEALGSVFVGRNIMFHSAFFTLSLIIREFLPNISHYTIVDITSLATSAAVVRQGAVMEHADSPLGWRAIVTELAKITGTTPTEALSRARMAAEDSCTDALCQSVLQSLSMVEPKFVDAYGKMLNELAKEKRIPGLLILIAPPELGGWFARIFARIDFAQFAISERPFTTQQLFASVLARHIDMETEAVEDAGVAIGAGFVHIRMRDGS